jgi:hypothetical protein
MKKFKTLNILVGLALCLSLIIPNMASAEELKLSFDHFYDYEELTQTLKAFEKNYPQFVKVKSLGKTHQGREIWSVILNNPKTGPAEHKPGYYIDGNIHGNEIQGTEVAIYAIWHLLNNYGKTDLATRLLDEKAFYMIPTMNPDSRDHFINRVSDPDSPRTGLIPMDDDQDGVADEDGPDDLDGDGSITMMRKKDPNGYMIPHPEDSRILIPVQPGQKGEYTMLGQEGIDNDGDGLINEDPMGGYDMNRNYGYNWQPNYVQMGSGHYPFCWPETKATSDFLLAHPNIFGAQNFHNFGGMILVGPGANNLGDYPRADMTVYDYIGNNGEKILPGYRYIKIYSDLYTVFGGSVDWIYSVLGIYTYSNELDMDAFDDLAAMLGTQDEEEQDENLARLHSYQQMLNEMAYYDLVLMGEQFTDWKPYDHPLYGEVEIGGVKKFGRRVPPLFRLAETSHRNAAFCLYHADQLPRLSFDEVKVKKLEKDLYQIDVAIENSRVTPTISFIAQQKKLHRMDRLQIDGNNVKLLAAGQLMDKYRDITQKIETQKNFLWIQRGIPSFGRVVYRLLVQGKGEMKLIYDSLKGGYYTTTTNLQ